VLVRAKSGKSLKCGKTSQKLLRFFCLNLLDRFWRGLLDLKGLGLNLI
jgi:hypothetical protein